ncbi:MAG: GlsB/YeaQ/YmgE family stress response membrane protein [Planctomycetota bacterium]|jgi:LPXTG-motif cell wall-anchored protein
MDIDIKLSEIIVWLIVGALAGTLIGWLVTRQKAGFGAWKNLGVGLVGALIGGVLFKLIGIELFPEIKISAHNILSALIGSVIFIGFLAYLRRRKRKKQTG